MSDKEEYYNKIPKVPREDSASTVQKIHIDPSLDYSKSIAFQIWSEDGELKIKEIDLSAIYKSD